jgi:hypothetical protein
MPGLAVMFVVAACGGTRERPSRASRSGEEPCTRPRVALEPPPAGAPARSVDLDVSARHGRERIRFEGRRLEIRDSTGELLLAVDGGMEGEGRTLPTVLRWTRSALEREDLLLLWNAKAHPEGSPEGCLVDEQKVVVYRDLQPGSAPAMEEVVRRGRGCGRPGFRVRAGLCEDGDVVRLQKRTRSGGRIDRVRRYDDVSNTFGRAMRPTPP